MRRGRSTCNPTKAESARIVAAKEGACVCCTILAERGDLHPDLVVVGCDYHHMKSGNVRRGHEFGIGLCLWHHRGQPWAQWTTRNLRHFYGPSLMDGSRRFHDHYGSDTELLAKQDQLLGINRIEEKAA